jgi:hypothetical protein
MSRISKRNQMRIAIAQDILLQVLYETFDPSPGTYVRFGGGDSIDILQTLSNEAAAGAVKTRAPKCEVCAIGAMFVSAVRLFNKFDAGTYSGDDWEMRRRLAEFFTRDEMLEIEAFFECWGGETAPGVSTWAWGAHYNNLHSADRLCAVMSSIIANDGKLDWRDELLSSGESGGYGWDDSGW